jgi:hypothetical protein
LIVVINEREFPRVVVGVDGWFHIFFSPFVPNEKQLDRSLDSKVFAFHQRPIAMPVPRQKTKL